MPADHLHALNSAATAKPPVAKPDAPPKTANKTGRASTPVDDKPRQAEARPKHVLEVQRHATKSDARVMAELGLSPILGNFQTTRAFNRGHARSAGEELDATEAVAVMREKVSSVQAGNLAGLEETLTAQAVALDAIFTEMARRAVGNFGEYLPAAETFMRLGLKAQAQCRATIQTLAEMKNPHPATFVRQANIANGPQQVNNGTQATSSRAEISVNPANKLLGLNHEQRLDAGTTGATSGADPEMAALGPVHRPED